MFGYIRPEKGSLLVREFARYRSIYCGLCKQMKREYGNLPRLTLTYDLTFLALLLISLSEEDGMTAPETCILNPVRKKPILSGHRALEQCAGLSILLFKGKLEDDFRDRKGHIKKYAIKIITTPITRQSKSSEKKMKREATAILDGLQNLSKFENQSSCDGDTFLKASELFGEILKEVFLFSFDGYFKEDKDRELLREGMASMGLFIGKWIYLIDAIDDFNTDIQLEQFNPFSSLTYDQAKEKAGAECLLCEEKIDQIAALLPYKRDSGIVKNIVQQGMPYMREQIFSGHKAGKL